MLLVGLATACGPGDHLLGRKEHERSGRGTTGGLAATPYGPAELLLTGGIAGIERSPRLRVDGSFTRLERGHAPTSGQLTASDHAALRRLLTSGGLTREAATRPPVNCADGFAYRLTTAGLTITRTDCGTIPAAPTLSAIVDLLRPLLKPT